MLKDPFLNKDPAQAKPAPPDTFIPMPWLSNEEEPRAIPTADQIPSSETTVRPEPKANAAIEVSTPKPEAKSEQPLPEQPPINSVNPTSQEPADKQQLVEQSWLRVQLQPEIKSGTNSI